MTAFKMTLAFGLVAFSGVCRGQESFTIRGLGGTSVVLSAADLAKFPHKTVTTTDHGAPAAFDGVLLADVLAKVDLPLGDRFHSTAAGYYVLAEGSDGYRALFAWAELDATFMDKAIYVVTSRDGKLLPAKDGPFQLVVPGEKRGGRWVRHLITLTVQLAK